jgi:hypothetical protein
MKCIFEKLLNVFRVDYRSLTSDQYAKIQEMAEKIENDASSMAINLDDYSKRAMDHVAKIQKACEEKRYLIKQESFSAPAPSDERSSLKDIAENEVRISSLFNEILVEDIFFRYPW